MNNNQLKFGDIFDPESKLAQWERQIWDQLMGWIENLEPPLCIGIFGDWGSGKSSLFRVGCERYESESPEQKLSEKPSPAVRVVNITDALAKDGIMAAIKDVLPLEPEQKGQSAKGEERGPFIFLIDDLEKLDSAACCSKLKELGQCLKVLGAKSHIPKVYFFVGTNEKLLLKRLEPIFHGMENAEEFLASVIPVEYYLPRASGEDVEQTFLQADGGLHSEKDDASHETFPRNFIKLFCRNFPTANLRTARRFIVTLDWFAQYAFRGPYNEIIKKVHGDKESLKEALQIAGCLLTFLRFFQADAYNELVANPHKIDEALECFATLDMLFARKRAGFVPSVEQKELRQTVDRLSGAGLYRLADSLKNGSLIKDYRLFREIANNAFLEGKKLELRSLTTFYQAYKEQTEDFFTRILSQ